MDIDNKDPARGIEPNIVLARCYLEALSEVSATDAKEVRERKIADLRKKAVDAAAAGVAAKGNDRETLLQAAQIALQCKDQASATTWASQAKGE